MWGSGKIRDQKIYRSLSPSPRTSGNSYNCSFILCCSVTKPAACQASLSTISQGLLKLMSIQSVMLSKHILCCPLLILPSIFPSIRVFSNESALRIGWPKYWNFSFSISPAKEYSGLISFRMGWLDLLAVFSNTTVQKQFSAYNGNKPKNGSS